MTHREMNRPEKKLAPVLSEGGCDFENIADVGANSKQQRKPPHSKKQVLKL